MKASLIASFVRYAHDIGATVCAEGIETMKDLGRLADLDVAYGQDYGIARPAPPLAPATEQARWPAGTRPSRPRPSPVSKTAMIGGWDV